MDMLITVGYVLLGIVGLILAFYIGKFVLYCLIVGIGLAVLAIPFLLTHISLLISSPKRFMQEFLACAPCFGEKLSEKLYMERRQKWLNSLSDIDREAYLEYEYNSFLKSRKKRKEEMDHESYMKNKYGKNWQEKFF